MESIRIMLVDDHEIVRTGLKTFLDTQEGMHVIAEASTGEEAIMLVQENVPDIVVMDLTMPGIGGLGATRQLVSLYPGLKVLVLTVHTDQQYFFEAMAAGAVGYVTKQSASDDLVNAILAVAHGNVYLQPVLARWLLEDYRRLLVFYDRQELQMENHQLNASSLDVLSKREQQVVVKVAQGMTNSQIGDELGISPKTVARHRERIMHKLNIHSTTELVKFAVRTGLVDIE
jgi:RNA polymerase sigma factor (sigma-70 family)